MKMFTHLRHDAARVIRTISPDAAADIHEYRIAPRTLRDGRSRTETLEQRITDLESTVGRLDADLMESRRLNLRAAELLDIVQTEIVDAATPATNSSASIPRG